MKNMKRSLMAIAALVATGSMASLMQPGVPAREDAPLRLTIGTTADLVNRPENDKASIGEGANGFGLDSWNGGLGFSHNVGYGFEYGLAASFGRAYPKGKLFNEASRKGNYGGWDLNVELLLRYMPEVADGFNMGIYTTLGFNQFFYNKDKNAKYKLVSDAVSFADLNFQAGLGFSYRFTDMFAMYINPAFQLSNIRMWKADGGILAGKSDEQKKEIKKALSCIPGIVIPVGAKIDFTEGLGLYLEYAAKFNKLGGKNVNFDTGALDDTKVMDNYSHGVTVGLVFEI